MEEQDIQPNPVIFVALISLAVGGAIGYFVGKRQGAVIVVPEDLTNDLKPDPNQLTIKYVEREMAEMLDGEATDSLDEHVQDPPVELYVVKPSVLIPDPEPVVENVFDNSDEWDWEIEKELRSAGQPYVIHYEEYIADDMGFHQDTCTYFNGDDIMVDSNDVPVYNHAGVFGELKFGHGSRDPNVVYIRNEQAKQEWEVLFDSGSYQATVTGTRLEEDDDNHLRHSVLKFRDN